MPVKQLLKYQPSGNALELKNELIKEWKNQNSTNDQPVILEEVQQPYPTIHLFVIWDDWKDMEQTERSEIILDAFKEIRGEQKALDVTVSMGLTTNEAQRMKIQYK